MLLVGQLFIVYAETLIIKLIAPYASIYHAEVAANYIELYRFMYA